MDIKIPIFNGDEFLYYLSCDFFEPPEGITNKFKMQLVLKALSDLNKEEDKNYTTRIEGVEITPNKEYHEVYSRIVNRIKEQE